MSWPENKLPLMDMQMSTSKNRMRAFRTRPALVETILNKKTIAWLLTDNIGNNNCPMFVSKKQTKKSTRILYLVANTK